MLRFKQLCTRPLQPAEGVRPTELFPTNKNADSRNRCELQQLAAPEFRLLAEDGVSGRMGAWTHGRMGAWAGQPLCCRVGGWGWLTTVGTVTASRRPSQRVHGRMRAWGMHGLAKPILATAVEVETLKVTP